MNLKRASEVGAVGHAVRRAMYRTLSLDRYLKTLSGMYLLGYRTGIGRSAAYEYPRFLKNLVSEGDTAIDIGANLGYYSYALASLVGPQGRVRAVEPVEPIRRVLRHNLRRFRHVEVLACALGDADRTIRMGNATVDRDGYFGTGQNFVLDKPAAGLALVEFEAEMRRGSELFASLDRIDLIKCDIEGYELVVMTEMRPLLERHHPTVLIETGGDNRPRIVALFGSIGYDGYVLSEGTMRPLADGDTKDIVFVHRSRRERYQKRIRP